MSDTKLDSMEQKASYGIGFQMGQQLARSGMEDVDVAAIQAGLADAINGAELRVPVPEIEAAMTEMNKAQKAKAEAKQKEAAAEGEKFLEENAKREGVVVLDSGLQYEIIEPGEGDEKPTADSKVRTHYHGTFINGDVFDSSYERGSPIQFDVSGVIPGWTEALQLMNKGAKWRLYVPYQLAYGEQGAGGSIPPYSTLIFDVELLDID